MIKYILVFFLMPMLLGRFMDVESVWYKSLIQSPLTPPGYVFGIVWPILYFCMAIYAYYLFSQKGLKYRKIFFIFQFILNLLWNPVFSLLHMIELAAILILLMIVSLTFIIFAPYFERGPKKQYSVVNKATLLLIPYYIWLMFAFYLSYYMVINN